MKQVVQPLSGGPVRVVDVPRPVATPTEVLVQTVASVVSPGTERAVTALARSSLWAKAKARPDLVREVVRRARVEGIPETVRKVHDRLGEDLALGYSAAGIAVEVGEYVDGIVPGQLVATGGAGKANHAEFQAVPGLLCCPVPDGVAPRDAAFATLGAVALHGLRLAEVSPGASVVVIGLGLVGQLTARLAQASGCAVAGIDVAELAVRRAQESGVVAMVDQGEDTTAAILEWSRGRGADAVMLTAAGSSSEAVRRTPALCRDRATVVVVGDVGLELERTPFYEKELALRFARSYGPGRYERTYEEWAVDYPAGQVRWTEGRNLEAVVDLLASGRLRVGDLVTHEFPITQAAAAYELIETRREPSVGVVIRYAEHPRAEHPRAEHPRAEESPAVRSAQRRAPAGPSDGRGIGLVGAGAFASGVLVPALREAGLGNFVAVASASGLSARRLAERAAFERAVSGADAVIEDPEVDVVVIATPHDTHAALAARALRAGKHVFCEKPLALTADELDALEAAWRASGRVLFVGFNRRYSPAVRSVQAKLAGAGPLVITYRVNAGPVPKGHWYADRRQGGRLLGEVCHFVDTCAAVVGADAIEGVALGGVSDGGARGDDAIVTLGYPDGSLATIAYAARGHAATEKEHVEVMGRGHTAVIHDFRELVLDGRRTRGPQDKGHRGLVAAFAQALESGDPQPGAFASSRTILRAAALRATALGAAALGAAALGAAALGAAPRTATVGDDP